jgi:carbonic anhydrase/acetyltransferase-like protein (isoleucine patch superfamily)
VLVKGTPGKVVGEVTPEQIEGIHAGTRGYVRNWRRYKAGLGEV